MVRRMGVSLCVFARFVIAIVALVALGTGLVFAQSERYTLPGAAASFVLKVTTAAITVRIALRLNVSACAMTTGCLKPGPAPVGCGVSAQEIVIGSSSGSRTA